MTARTSSRTAILDAALACTRETGWESTSLQTVRERAGVSNGTLFHHFPTRETLADALVTAGLADHQAAVLRELTTPGSTRQAVARVVLAHLRWVENNPRLARLLLSTPRRALLAGLDERALSENRKFFDGVSAWLREAGWSGAPNLTVLIALWIGPAQEYARGWLAAPESPLTGVADVLAEGAWRALKPHLQKRVDD